MFLPRTHDALIELAANNQISSGVHTHDLIKAGQSGIPLGDVEFDPYKHDVIDINHLSAMGEATGQYFVTEVLPNKPININVVTDFGVTGDSQVIKNLKHQISNDITSSLETALPSITDRMFKYSFGQAPTNSIHDNYELLPDTSDFERAEIAARLCANGLTMIISDFKHVPFNEVSNGGIPGVAVKVNHPLERELKPNIGIISLGRGVEVDTKKPKQLEKINMFLEARRQAILEQLGNAGLQVAEVVYDPRQAEGFDVDLADYVIAEAVKAYAKSY